MKSILNTIGGSINSATSRYKLPMIIAAILIALTSCKDGDNTPQVQSSTPSHLSKLVDNCDSIKHANDTLTYKNEELIEINKELQFLLKQQGEKMTKLSAELEKKGDTLKKNAETQEKSLELDGGYLAKENKDESISIYGPNSKQPLAILKNKETFHRGDNISYTYFKSANGAGAKIYAYPTNYEETSDHESVIIDIYYFDGAMGPYGLYYKDPSNPVNKNSLRGLID